MQGALEAASQTHLNTGLAETTFEKACEAAAELVVETTEESFILEAQGPTSSPPHDDAAGVGGRPNTEVCRAPPRATTAPSTPRAAAPFARTLAQRSVRGERVETNNDAVAEVEREHKTRNAGSTDGEEPPQDTEGVVLSAPTNGGLCGNSAVDISLPTVQMAPGLVPTIVNNHRLINKIGYHVYAHMRIRAATQFSYIGDVFIPCGRSPTPSPLLK